MTSTFDCFSSIFENAFEDFLVELTGLDFDHKPVADVSEACAVGLITGRDYV